MCCRVMRPQVRRVKRKHFYIRLPLFPSSLCISFDYLTRGEPYQLTLPALSQPVKARDGSLVFVANMVVCETNNCAGGLALLAFSKYHFLLLIFSDSSGPLVCSFVKILYQVTLGPKEKHKSPLKSKLFTVVNLKRNTELRGGEACILPLLWRG